MSMSIAQVMAEVGRLHMENLELRAENADLRAALAASAQGGPAVELAGESGSPTVAPAAPQEVQGAELPGPTE